MNAPPLLIAALFGAWTWTTTRPPARPHAWPSGLPEFAGAAQVGYSASLPNGTKLVNLVVQTPAEAVLASAGRAFYEAGWRESPVRTRDMLIFTRGPAVAAVLAESVPEGTRVTAIQRASGL